MHAHGLNLVYGGGTVGIMGEVAKTLVSLSGPESVHGIIPAALVRYEQNYDPSDPDSIHKAIDKTLFGRTTVVKDMHTRKQMMAREVMDGGAGGGFVALSGGFGTLEELAEVTTWNQLGIHGRPVCLYNIDSYWDGLVQWISTAVGQGFISEKNGGIIVVAKEAEEVIVKLREYRKSDDRFKLNWEEK